MPLSAFQPERYDELLSEKIARVCDLLAPFDPPAAQIFPSQPSAYRMRAEFRMWHEGDKLDYVMFRRDAPKIPVPVSDFPIACEAIQALMPQLIEQLRCNPTLRRKLFQVEFLSTLAGDTLVTLVYHRPLDEAWEMAARDLAQQLTIPIVGRSRKQKVVIGRDHVRETLLIKGREYHYRQYEQSFTQPNALLNIAMLEWACTRAQTLQGDLLELYCGNGNFTLPLSQHFDNVIATEVAKTATRAARENLRENSIDNVQMIRLSAEEVSEALAGKREFRRLAELPNSLQDYHLDTLFVDPPRAGLDTNTEIMCSRFKAILYVSCNPHTLAQNLARLCKTHRIETLALFDQFPYTDHMECAVLLQARERT